MKDITYEVESIYNDFDNNLITSPKDFTIASKEGRLVGSGSKYNGIYRVVYPVTGIETVDQALKMHEYGHIYLGHFEGIHEDMDRALMRIITTRDSQLVQAVNEKCNIDYADKILDRVISEPFLNHFIHNISMDMEVNSTILNKEDINEVSSQLNMAMYEEYMRISENGTKKPSDKALDNLHSKFDLKLVHPSDFGFKEGLTYPDYLVQCILNLDMVLNLLSNSMNNSGRAKERRDQCQNSMEGGDSGCQGDPCDSDSQSQNSKNANDNSSMPKTMEEFEEMMRNAQGQGDSDKSDDHQNDSQGGSQGKDQNEDGDSSNQNGQSNQNDTDEEDQDDGQGQGNDEDDSPMDDSDHGTESRDEADDSRRNDLGNYYSAGGNGAGNQDSDDIRNYEVNNDPLSLALEEVIREYRHKVIKRDFAKDMTHKYNRRILGANNKMLSPTYRQKITKTEEPTILFAVDVSGSMDTSLVDRIVTSIRNKMKRINSSLKYNLVAWDTRLQQYYKNITFDTPIPKLSCGGGTRMGGVFDLFKKDFGKESILILISDFGDEDLGEWHRKEQEMNGYSMYGFKYDNGWGGSNNLPQFKNFKVRYCD